MITLRGRRTPMTLLALAIELASATTGRAQASQVLPPIRRLGSPIAVAHDTIGLIRGTILPLSDGRVMINDMGKRRVVILDAALSHPLVIADSTAVTNKAYGGQMGTIIAYRADSTIFVDPRAVALLVIDPSGAIARTIAPPRPSDIGDLVLPMGSAGFDAKSRLVYRDLSARCSTAGTCGAGRGAPPPAPSTGQSASMPGWALHDSVAVLRGDLATHIVDTIGFIATPPAPRQVGSTGTDGWTTMSAGNPFPFYDDCVVVSDGSVAMLRAQDYHLDWINADGSRTSTPKIAHEWHRLSDSEKTKTIDSMRIFLDSGAKMATARAARSDSIARLQGDPEGTFPKVLWQVPDISDLPDYTPPVDQQALIADADNNVWIRQGARRPTFGPPPPVLYDVVDRSGRLVDRVEIPSGLTVAGFGRGVVYLTSREGSGTRLSAYRIP